MAAERAGGRGTYEDPTWPTDAVILAADLLADVVNWIVSGQPLDAGISRSIARERLDEYRRLRRG